MTGLCNRNMSNEVFYRFIILQIFFFALQVNFRSQVGLRDET